MNSLYLNFSTTLSVMLIISISLFNNVNAQCPTSIANHSKGKKIELNGHGFTSITNINIAGATNAFSKTLSGNSTTEPKEAKNHFDPCFLPGNSCALAITHHAGTDVCDYDDTGSLKTPSPLPIELINFEVKLADKNITVAWKTATEINNNFFTVERSSDAINWTVINIIPGAGNSNSLLEYSLVDFNPLKGTNYYRLKQTDYDGKYTYSRVQTIKFVSNKNVKSNLKVFPNPSLGSQINFEISIEKTNENYSIVIYNMLGENIYHSGVMRSSSNLKNAGQLNLNSKLRSGTYIIKLHTSNSTAMQKLIVN